MPAQSPIAQRVVDAILAGRLAPGGRLGEQDLAELFGVSRTLVREALMQLHTRGFVEVKPRRGWFVVQPSFDEAREAYAARRVIETGLLREAGKPLQSVIRRLRRHVADERRAIASGDPATRSFLLADFHACLAECLGHRLLAGVMRDLTARTTLASSLYQSSPDAGRSCDDHAAIVAALADGDSARAVKLMTAHIGDVQSGLDERLAVGKEKHARLRASLEPVITAA
ncbi:MAG: GntR family transcriptional regulator [Proteobacteria bacterium]|nr:GntR family transcriptional regulator [Pseudomonadota bacterium]